MANAAWQMAEMRSNRVYFVSPAAKISSKALRPQWPAAAFLAASAVEASVEFLRHMVPLCVNDRTVPCLVVEDERCKYDWE